MRLSIIGCGYTGLILARKAVAAGHEVTGTTTTTARLEEIARTGAEPRLVAEADLEALGDAMAGADSVVWLAPPGLRSPNELAVGVSRAFPASARALVYGSTTGVYGPRRPDEVIDELAEVGEPSLRGRARLAMERSLFAAGLPLRVVRIAGIYGPGRTLRDGIVSGSLLLFEGGPVTSRIHVVDLSRILLTMAFEERAPELVVATDERPATTLEVARFTAARLGVQLPPVLSLDEARRRLSPAAAELRLEGRRCRSLRREGLMGQLTYSSYVEGVIASLE